MHDFIQNNFDTLQTLIIYWLLFWIVVSVIYQIFKRDQLPAIAKASIRFHEGWTSGRSFKNLFTRLGGAKNALSVTVGDNYLLLKPHFPFNLLFVAELSDLVHAIPLQQITQVERVASFGRNGVRVHFYTQRRNDNRVELYLRKPEQFLAALGRQ